MATPSGNDIARLVEVLAEFRDGLERGDAKTAQSPHLLHGRDTIGIQIHPDAQLRPDGVGFGDEAVVVAAELARIVLRETDEAIGRTASLENQRRADAEQLCAIVDDVAGAVEREKPSSPPRRTHCTWSRTPSALTSKYTPTPASPR
jgi:hypothetical protein